MTLYDFLIAVAVLSLIAVTFALVPALLQIRRTVRRAEESIATLNQDLGPLLQTLTETSKELNLLSANLNDKISKTDHIFDTVQRSTDTLLFTSNMVKDSVVPVAAQIGGFNTGIRTFLKFFSKKKDTNKGGTANE